MSNEKITWKGIAGFLNDEEAELLQTLGRGKVCLEIGALHGKSTVALAEVAKKVHSVDCFQVDWGDPSVTREIVKGNYDAFFDSIKGYDNIVPHVGFSFDIVSLIDEVFDLIFIDASHEYDNCLIDIGCSWARLKVGGYMAFHDYGPNSWGGGVYRAVNNAFPKKEIKSVIQTGYFMKEEGDILCWGGEDV